MRTPILRLSGFAVVAAAVIATRGVRPASGAEPLREGWAVRLAAGSGDEIRAIAAAPDGTSVAVVGFTTTAVPVAGGAVSRLGNPGFVGTPDVDGDVFVVKLDNAGRRVFSALLGGAGRDEPFAVAVAANGDVVVAGESYSSDFPGVGGYLGDGFVTRIAADGASIRWSRTFSGAGTEDAGLGVAVAGDDRIAVAGKRGEDAAVLVFGTAGDLVFDRTFGGSRADRATHAAFDLGGKLYVLGSTASADLPTSAPTSSDPYLNAADGGPDLFAARFDTDGNRTWLVYTGTTAFDYPTGLAIDAQGVLIGGRTDTQRGYVRRLPITGGMSSGLLSSARVSHGFVVGPDGEVWRDASDEPRPTGFDPPEGDGGDVALFGHDVTTGAFRRALTFGGTGAESVTAFAGLPDGDLVVGGTTTSPSLPFAGDAAATSRDFFIVRVRPQPAGPVTNVATSPVSTTAIDVTWDPPPGLLDAVVRVHGDGRAPSGPYEPLGAPFFVDAAAPVVAGTVRVTVPHEGDVVTLRLQVVRTDRGFGPAVTVTGVARPPAPRFTSLSVADGEAQGELDLSRPAASIDALERRVGDGPWTELGSLVYWYDDPVGFSDWIGGFRAPVTYRSRSLHQHYAVPGLLSPWTESAPVEPGPAFDLTLDKGRIERYALTLGGAFRGAPGFRPRTSPLSLVIDGGPLDVTSFEIPGGRGWRRSRGRWTWTGRIDWNLRGRVVVDERRGRIEARVVRPQRRWVGGVLDPRSLPDALHVLVRWGGAAARDDQVWTRVGVGEEVLVLR